MIIASTLPYLIHTALFTFIKTKLTRGSNPPLNQITMTIHKTKAQTFMVDTNLGAEIQLLLANARVKNKVTYTSISDFVNQAIKEKLAKEAKK
jgi:hypothetical protein